MSGLEIRWPDAAVERVRAAQGRLARAGEALRVRSLADRIGVVARVLDDWTRPDSPWRRELVESFAASGPFGLGTVREGLESALRAWQPARFVEAAERELASVLPGPDGRRPARALAPYAWTVVFAGGTIPMPTLLTSLLPLVLGSPVLLRETAKDPVTGRLLARSLAERDEELARAFEPIEFPSDDDEALAALLGAPCIVATGSDETLHAIGRRLRIDQRYVAYGHRVSIAIVGPAIAERTKEIADALALDVARWDQTGCLSPISVLLVGWEPSASRAFAREVAKAHQPPAALQARALFAAERDEARMREAAGRALLIAGSDSVVVLEDDARPRPAPLHRFVRLLPVESLTTLPAALTGLAESLSSVAIAGFDPDARVELVGLLETHGVSRVTAPGRLQTPPVDWPRDGLPLFASLARMIQTDV